MLLQTQPVQVYCERDYRQLFTSSLCTLVVAVLQWFPLTQGGDRRDNEAGLQLLRVIKDKIRISIPCVRVTGMINANYGVRKSMQTFSYTAKVSQPSVTSSCLGDTFDNN